MDETGVDQTRNKNGKDARKAGLIFMIFEDARTMDGDGWKVLE
jgi:hypothetical protein